MKQTAPRLFDRDARGGATRPRALALVALTVALGASMIGCSETIYFEGKAAFPIQGEARPPRVAKRKAALKNKKIEIMEKVQFEVDQAIIQPVSYQLLDDVALVIKENPQIKRISIEGHASAEGDDWHNLDLSDRRAKAVRDYLIQHAVDQTKLVATGYGETRPIADNNTQEGRERNRRVEFNVVDDNPIPPPPILPPRPYYPQGTAPGSGTTGPAPAPGQKGPAPAPAPAPAQMTPAPTPPK